MTILQRLDPRTWRWGDQGGWLKRGKHPQRWSRARLPIALYVAKSAEPWWWDVAAAIYTVNRQIDPPLAVGPFLVQPIESPAPVAEAFAGDPAGWPVGSVHVVGDAGLIPEHGSVQLACDDVQGVDAYGEIYAPVRAAILRLPLPLPDWAAALAAQQLYHVLGLARGAGLLAPMGPESSRRLTRHDVRRLRGAYGRA